VFAAIKMHRLGSGIDDAIVTGIDREGAQVPLDHFRPALAGILAAIKPVMGYTGEDDLGMAGPRMNAIDDRTVEGFARDRAVAVFRVEHDHAFMGRGVKAKRAGHGGFSAAVLV